MRIFLIISIIIATISTQAQQKLLPLNQQFYTWEEANFNRVDNQVHTSTRPILESDFNRDSLTEFQNERFKRLERTRWLGRKLKSEHFIRVINDEFKFTIDPVLNMEYGMEQSDLPDSTTLYKNTRGIWVDGDIGKHVSFSTAFFESQAVFPSYVDSYIRKTNTDPLKPNEGVIPGQGKAKAFKGIGFDYGMSMANVSYSPNSYFNFQMGYGKNFIGEGYRSLLLSDVAFNYPFVKITSKIGKRKLWQYSNIYSTLIHLDRVPETIATESQFIRKGGTFHYLSFAPNPRLQIGFYEGTIFQRWDADSAVSTTFNPMQLNPIIGLNSLVYGVGDLNNTVLGINLKITPINFITIYGQYVYDDGNKYGYQAGIKVYELGGLVPNLSIRMEYNRAMPFTFSYNQPIQNYGHYGQPLGHIYGSDFSEALAIINYNIRDIFVQAKYISANRTIGFNDIYQSYENIDLTLIEPIDEKLTYLDFQLGYMVNPVYKMNIVAGATIRNAESVVGNTSSTYVYLAFRTSLRNLYYDF